MEDMDERMKDAATALSSADEADCGQAAAASPDDSSDGSCSAHKPVHGDVLAAVKKQVEFYFSDANLPTDKHLLKQIQKDPEGYVPLRMIANFKRVKALTKDSAVVAEALKGSELLSLDDSDTRVRRCTPLPAFDVTDITRRTVVVEHLPDKPTIESVTQLLSQYGEVIMVRICSRGNTNKLPGWLSKAVDAINMTMAPGEFALVEFRSEDNCVACVSKTRNPDNWRTSLRVRHLLPSFKPSHNGGNKPSISSGGGDHGEGKQHGRERSTGGTAEKQKHNTSSSAGRHSHSKFGVHEQQQHVTEDSTATAAAAAATAAAGSMPKLTPIKTSAAQVAAGQRSASPHANGSAGRHDVVGSPAGLSPIKVSSAAASASAGVGGSIGSPRTASSPAPAEVSSFIDSILSAPTGNTPTKGGSNSSRWSGAGDWGSNSSNITPAAAVAAALAGVSTPPQSNSPRHSAAGGTHRGSSSGVGLSSGVATPTRLSSNSSNASQLVPTQSALAAQLAAAAAAAAQAAMAGSPKAVHGSNAASWRSPRAAAGQGISISAPNTPLAGMSAGDAVAEALDEELFSGIAVPSRQHIVGSPELSSPKPGPWVPASRLQHMQQAAVAHDAQRSSGSEPEDNVGSWKRSSWTGQAGSLPTSGMKPPKPRVSGTGTAGASSSGQRRPSWHALDADEVAGRLEGLSSSGVDSSDGAAAEVSQNRSRRSRLQQASGDYKSLVDSVGDVGGEAGAAAAAQAMASLNIGGSQHQRRRSSNTGAPEAKEDCDDEHEDDDHVGEGGGSGKSRRRRRKRSSTGSRRASLDEGAVGRRTSTEDGHGRTSGRRQSEEGSGARSRRGSLDIGPGAKPGSKPHNRAGGTLSPEDTAGHRQSSSGSKHHDSSSQAADHHRSSHDGAAKDSKKKEKKDYASWAAATPEFRAAAKHSNSSHATSGAGLSAGLLGTSPGRAGQAGISPLRASAGGAPGSGHDAESHVRIARMPDGTRGFGLGRGRPVSPGAP